MIDFYQLDTYGRIKFVFQNLQILIALVGICGSLLTFCVFSRARLRKYSYSFFSRAIAVSDIIVLIHSFRHWASNILEADIDLVNQFFCSIGEFQPYSATMTSLWLLTLMSLDRLTTIVYPNRFKLLKSRWTQFLLVSVVVVYSMLMSINLPLNFRLVTFNYTSIMVDSTNLTETIHVCSISAEASNRHSWIVLGNIIIVNIFLNNVLNIRMIRYVFASRRNVAVFNHQACKSSVRDRKFAISSIGLNFCCLIFKLPLTIGFLVLGYLKVDPDLFDMVFTICVTISTIDNCDSFFVNMIVNTSFHDEFVEMVGKWWGSFGSPKSKTPVEHKNIEL